MSIINSFELQSLRLTGTAVLLESLARDNGNKWPSVVKTKLEMSKICENIQIQILQGDEFKFIQFN